MSQSDFTIAENHTEFPGVVIDIIEWPHMRGMTDPRGLVALAAARTAGAAARQVRITIPQQGEVTLEAGALQFWRGRFDMDNRIPAGKVIKRLFGSAVTGESVFRPTYRGKGEIWLEPSLGHFLVVNLENDTIIVDQGAFHACDAAIKIEARMQKNISSAVFGGEGLFQTALSGTGFVVLQSPVPDGELVKLEIAPGEKAVVDGPFALMRTDNIEFTVGKSARTWVGSAVSGDGMLHTFENRSQTPGLVWVSPLEPVYNAFSGFAAMVEGGARPGGASR